jgi:cell division protease FtsH
MVCQYGMAKDLGPASYDDRRGPTFLGRDLVERSPYAEATVREIDVAVREILKDLESKAEEALHKHGEALRALQAELEERETLSAEEVRALLPDLPYGSIDT